jgi:glycosyltransferase involved in cell wall biosynthesis
MIEASSEETAEKVVESSSKSKIRIVYTLVGNLAWRGRLLKEIATLQEAGLECRLVYGDRGDMPLDRSKFPFEIESISAPMKWGMTVHFAYTLRFCYWASRRIAESDATHVVCFSAETLLAGALAKRKRPDLKLIFDSNELHVECAINPARKKLLSWIQEFGVPSCDVIMHAEANRAEYFRKHYDPGNREYYVLENLPNFIERSEIGEKPECPPTRVLYVGVLGFDRYTKELIDIFRELAPEYSLDIVGTARPEFIEEIKAILEENPAPNVRILPGIPYKEMSNLIRNYHVGIALYKNNTLNNYYCAPNKVYDYLMNGAAVIANDYPGLRAVIEDGKVGACIEEVDAPNFRRALKRITRERLMDNITEDVRKRYSWESQVPGFVGLFE